MPKTHAGTLTSGAVEHMLCQVQFKADEGHEDAKFVRWCRRRRGRRGVAVGAGDRSKHPEQRAEISVAILSRGPGGWRRGTGAEARTERDLGRTLLGFRRSPAEGRGRAPADRPWQTDVRPQQADR